MINRETVLLPQSFGGEVSYEMRGEYLVIEQESYVGGSPDEVEIHRDDFEKFLVALDLFTTDHWGGEA